MDITGEYTVFAGEKPAGRLTVTRENNRTVFAFRSDAMLDVSRLVCVGEDTVASIGIPVPKGDALVLQKSFSDAAASASLPGRITRCLLVPTDAELSRFLPKKEPPKPEPGPEPEPKPAPEPKPEPQPTPEPEPGPAPEPPKPEPSPEPPKPKPEPEPASDTKPEPRSDAAPKRRAAKPSDAAQKPPSPRKKPAGTPYTALSEMNSPAKASRAQGWTREDDPARLFTDPALIEAARDIKGALIKRDGGAVLLACPWEEDAPFPLIPAFGGGTAMTIDGARRIVYRVRDGAVET